MLDVHDLKTRARRREAAGHPERALELYQVALRESRTTHRDGSDPGLCVRIADLHVDQGAMDEALDYYRTAAESFVEQGLLPNAIAVAHKILQLYPDEVEYHHLLADLHMEVGHVGEARTHLLSYLEAMRDAGRPEEAAEALEAFLARTRDPDMAEMGELLVEEARETAESLPDPEPEAEEDEEPEAEAADEAPEEDAEVEASAGVDADEEGDEAAAETEGEPAEEKGTATAVAAPETEEDEEQVEEDTDDQEPAPSPSPSAFDLGDGVQDGGAKRSDTPSLRERLGPSFEMESSTPSAPLDVPKSGPSRPGVEKPDAEDEDEDVEADGADAPSSTAAPAGALDGEVAEGLGEAAELEKGLEILEELLELAPENIDLRRRKILYARRLGRTENLHEAYLELGDALTEEDSRRAARICYEQVLAMDPENARALSGIARLDAGELEEKRKQGEDAGASNRTRRMTTAADQRARQKLSEILWAEFEESVRQLPWLDGATQTFQAAGTEFLPPIEAYEMLGRYLMAREKYEDAVEVLSLATGISDATEDELVDVFYYLAQAHERLGHADRARELYDQVADVDEEFRSAWEVIPGGEG